MNENEEVRYKKLQEYYSSKQSTETGKKTSKVLYVLLVWICCLVLWVPSFYVSTQIACEGGGSGVGALGCLAIGGSWATMFCLIVAIIGTVKVLKK